jgi:hypothetical protein
VRRVFIAATGALGLVPGAATIAKGLVTPPQGRLLFGGFVEAIGAGIIILLWINRKEFSQVAKSTLTRRVVVLTLCSFACLIAYLGIYDWCVVTHPEFGTVMFPLWSTGDLSVAIDKAGGRWAALDQYGTYAIVTDIQKSSSIAWAITIGVMLLLYQGVFSFFTVAFGLLAAREEAASLSRGKTISPRRRSTHRGN